MAALLHAEETVGHKHVGLECVCGVRLSQQSLQLSLSANCGSSSQISKRFPSV